jgi:hypothetical protein
MGDDASIYRAFSDSGIGEGPGSTPGPGVQYQDSGSSLEQNRTFLDAARLWMNLDEGDWGNLGDDFEAWSIAPIERDVLVARLVRFREYGASNRPNFFAHGRAVVRAEIEGAFDPGAWVGDAQAFDEPWLGRRRQAASPPPAPRAPAVAHAAADPEVATKLLAHLLEAHLQKKPLIWRVAPQEFRRSGKAAALASFARAALPLAIRHACFLRVYTVLPERFLDAGATFVVIQDDRPPILQGATRRYPDAFVLASDGRRVAGGEPRQSVATYADAVVRRFLDRSDALLLFGARAHAAIGGAEPTGSRRAYSVLYNVCEYARTGALDQALTFVAKQVEEKPIGPPPADVATVFSNEEWSRFSLAALVPVILRDAPEPEFQALRRACMGQIAEQRKTTLDSHSELEAWRQSFTSAQLPQLSQFVQVGILTPDLARQLLRQAGADKLATLSPEQLRPLLQVVDWRACLRLESSEVLTLARHGGALDLVNAVAGETGPLPDWLLAYVAEEPLARVDEAAGKGMIARASADSRWRTAALTLANRLLADPQTVAWSGFFGDFDTQPFVHDFELLLLLEELKSRAHGNTPSQVLRDRGQSPGFYEKLSESQRQTWVTTALDDSWVSVKPAFLVKDREFLAPPDPEYDDIVWRGLRSLLKPAAVRRLYDARRSGLDQENERGALEREFYEQIDASLSDEPHLANEWFGPFLTAGDPDASVADYSDWRPYSRLDPDAHAKVARAWYSGTQWKNAKRTARLIDWQVAMHDLAGRLDEHAMRNLIRGTAAPLGFPRVERFERQQMGGLCQAAANLTAFAVLAQELQLRLRNWSEDRPIRVFLETLKSDVAGTLLAADAALESPRFSTVTANGIRWLASLGVARDTGTQPPPLGLEDASALLDILGPSHEDVTREFARVALAELGRQPARAVELANHHRLFTEISETSDQYIERLRDVLTQHHAKPVIQEAALALEPLLTVEVRQRAAASRGNEGKTAREVAARHLASFPNVARFIDPVAAATATSGSQSTWAQELLRGPGPTWDELGKAYQRFLKTKAGENPLVAPYASLMQLGGLNETLADEARKVMGGQFRRWPELLQPGPRFSDGIPAVRLVLLIDPRSAVHCMRWVVARAAESSHGQTLLQDTGWWQVLNADAQGLRPFEFDDDRRNGRLALSAVLAELAVVLTADDRVGDAAWSAASGRTQALSRASVTTLRALRGK